MFLSIRGYLPGAYYGSLFGVATEYGKFFVDHITAHLTSQNSDCWIDGGDFVSSRNSYCLSMSH